MNTTLFVTRKSLPLVAVWRATGNPSAPLIRTWTQPSTTANATPSVKGGLRLCA